ncbi:MAG: glutamine synthetase [Rickettsiaceae bacterium]
MTTYTNESYLKLSEIDSKYNQLAKLQGYFYSKHKLTPVVGAELEFYLSPGLDAKEISRVIQRAIKSEKGQNQFEIDFSPNTSLSILAKEMEITRTNIIKAAQQLGGVADFRSKPFENDYGSSMHIHLNFLEDNNIEKYAKMLCKYLARYIGHCLPRLEDYKRLDSRFMAPTHISWGGNNRTVLIRIPDSLPRRLEHRLPSANADPAAVILSMLEAINYGLLAKDLDISQWPKIHGNAFDSQYSLEKIHIPSSLA